MVKPIKEPTEEQAENFRAEVRNALMAATQTVCKRTGAIGISVVVLGIATWATELYSLNPKAAAAFLRALATLCDPEADTGRKIAAENSRREAVKKLMQALDLKMGPTEGNA